MLTETQGKSGEHRDRSTFSVNDQLSLNFLYTGHKINRQPVKIFLMIRFQFNQFKGTITQVLIVIKSVQIDDFWTLDISISTLGMSVSTLDMLLSTLDSRQLPRLSRAEAIITGLPYTAIPVEKWVEFLRFLNFIFFRVDKSLACHSPAKWCLCA